MAFPHFIMTHPISKKDSIFLHEYKLVHATITDAKIYKFLEKIEPS